MVYKADQLKCQLLNVLRKVDLLDSTQSTAQHQIRGDDKLFIRIFFIIFRFVHADDNLSHALCTEKKYRV